ncbi:hypothetical protein D8B26_005024 [Coccidioides posadasii str. Silveira]|uniref:Uncharacterized protein n=2 Tax=Coccidioides posadasii TaxID=199306 RepID=E9D5I9_COCPS|nr:F-box domain containing protein [Coccidioides posadasii C735 delta SOWgp]EER24624.1 F-box domain containing protein [Coccidioides posadasii C735 delta SOWgp]EFW18183.1 conserved hypothetical protein [Coccidioides posadasii str. Silveira]QVM10364.1 hypothetical protein D8B26_005024 [Coccidioides posadasii str. Silveira]|eukprot:XP_003066769.1 F-box domain containing protein [Coccidioides posadasii C735 delta SOWgp]
MSFGTAYRWDKPWIGKLNLDPAEWHGDEPLELGPDEETDPKFKSAGKLGRMPLELIYKICLKLDVVTLANFRAASSSYRAVVDSVLQYRRLEEHAKDALKLLAITGVGKQYSLEEVYDEFCQPWCRACGKFGAYLFLPTLRRCCHNCHFIAPELYVASFTEVISNYGLPPDVASKLHVVHSLAGWYGTMRSNELWVHRDTLVSTYEAEQLALGLYGSEANMVRAFNRRKMRTQRSAQKQAQKSAQSTWLTGNFATLPRSTPMSIAPARFLFCRQFPLTRHFMATIAFPYFDQSTRASESGVYCKACTVAFERTIVEMEDTHELLLEILDQRYHRAYLEEDMPEHFATCSSMQMRLHDFPSAMLPKWPYHREGEDFLIEYEEPEEEELESDS